MHDVSVALLTRCVRGASCPRLGLADSIPTTTPADVWTLQCVTEVLVAGVVAVALLLSTYTILLSAATGASSYGTLTLSATITTTTPVFHFLFSLVYFLHFFLPLPAAAPPFPPP